ncbi:zinc finger BED domain-containing protein RICESLEEPER 2-like protein [Tanacetum coccineum]|uniref:Zinc finger BED domain-containing protein RICESLEEPER 2-like protein n=1 Tax=Tanacetum coccineum TaxID=301880 RepID=A0ABQ4ZPK7_9ASTR
MSRQQSTSRQQSMEGDTGDDEASSATSKLHSLVWKCFETIEGATPSKRKARCNNCDKVYSANPSSGVSNLGRHMRKCFDFGEDGPPTKRAPLDQDINTTKEDVLGIYKREKSNLKKELEKVSSRICFTSDLWSSITSDGYMALTAHYVDEDWVLRKKVLNFSFVPPPHTDNAKYNDGLVESLKDHLGLNNVLLCDGKFLHVHCGAHVLNLIVQSGLKVIEKSIEKVQDSVKYVRGSGGRKKCFSECIAHLQFQCGRLVCQDVVTRWNSTYMMLDCALAYKNAYARLKLVDTNYESCLLEDEWIRIKEITKFLKPFYDITKLFSGNSYPTSNLYFLKVYKIQSNIEQAIHNSDPVISKMGKEMKTKFEKYWDEYCKVLSFAIIMDPRYKVKIIEYCLSKLEMATEVREEKVEDIVECLYDLYNEYEFSFETHDDPLGAKNANVNEGDTVDELDELGGFESFRSCFRGIETSEKSELTLYLEEPEIPRKTKIDVLQYWKENKQGTAIGFNGS